MELVASMANSSRLGGKYWGIKTWHTATIFPTSFPELFFSWKARGCVGWRNPPPTNNQSMSGFWMKYDNSIKITWELKHTLSRCVSFRQNVGRKKFTLVHVSTFFFGAGMYIQLQVRSTRSKCVWRIVLFLSRLDNSWVVGLFGHLWWSVNSCVLDFV